MMRKMTLAAKLVLGGIALTLIPVVFVSLFSIVKSTSSLDSAGNNQYSSVAKSLAQMTQLALSEEMKVLQSLSLRPSIKSLAGAVAKDGAANHSDQLAAVTRELSEFMKQTGTDYEDIILTGPDGTIVANGANRAGGTRNLPSIGDRDYFKIAKQGKINIAPAVKSMATGLPIFPVCAPVFSSTGEVAGTISLLMNTDFFSKVIVNTKLGQTGYAFLLDQTGLIIAHPVKELILVNNLNTTSGMEELARRAGAKESGAQAYVFQGVEKLAGFAPVELTGWTVMVTGNRGEQLAPIYALRNILIISASLFLIAAAALIFLFARRITKPIMRIVRGVNEGADQVSSASGQVASSSQQLAEGASEQAAAIEETSSSLEEMSSMTKQNADNANTANRLMGETRGTVSRASQSMEKLTSSMGEISRASEETSKIIKTIDEIAFQTNLLALNAAVEAARAGEAGAGFAVVADEVRNLAMRAADAAKNTASLIEGTVKKVKEGSELVSETDKEFHEVAVSVGKSGELIGEISAACSEQAQGIEQVNKAVSEMDKVVQRNASNAEESAAAAEEMSAQSEQMKGFVGQLKSLVEGSKANKAVEYIEPMNGKSSSKTLWRAHAKAIGPGENVHARKSAGKDANGSEKATTRPERLIPFDDGEPADF